MKVILVINSGSSSIKFSIFSNCATTAELNLLYHGIVDNISEDNSIGDISESIKEACCLTIYDAKHNVVFSKRNIQANHESGLRECLNWLMQLETPLLTLVAVGHRVVHGGTYFLQPVLIDTKVIYEISKLNSLAPLHQPYNLEAIIRIKDLYPNLLQVACFDTTFHRTQTKLATNFAIPRHLTDAGIIRYGFHGISYEYIASVIEKHIGVIGNKRVIVAHLGNGASMCAMYRKKSVVTSMGFTALDGLMMGTRCGKIDPGVLLYLIQEKGYSLKQLEHLLYNESGLLGVSGISGDIRDLVSQSSHLGYNSHVNEAIELFCYTAACELGALAVALGGCDALIFTAGIGENATLIRKKICNYLAWMGIKLDDIANNDNKVIISKSDEVNRIIVGIIPTNEEYMTAKHTQAIVQNIGAIANDCIDIIE